MRKTHTSAVFFPNAHYSASVQRYVDAALSDNTLRAYQNDLRHFITWGGSIPATPESVANYLAQYAQVHACSTLARRLVAIDRAHRTHGLPSPTDSSLVRATLQGIRRTRGCAVRRVAAIQKVDLLQMLRGLEGLRGLRDRALLLVGFASALRRSELVSLNVTDVLFVDAGMIIRLRKSKTDQEGKGREILIPNVRGPNSPCKALKRWLAEANIHEGAIFRRISSTGNVLPKALSGQSVAIIVKRRAEDAGFDPRVYSGHSLRAGFVTDAAMHGAAANCIREQTGHKSDAMLQRYIRQAHTFSNNPLLTIW